jgi:hypothetical protein
LKTSISTNYPDIKFNLIKIKSLNIFKESLPKIIPGIDVSAVLTTDNILEHDLVAIASGPKYEAVSYK